MKMNPEGDEENNPSQESDAGGALANNDKKSAIINGNAPVDKSSATRHGPECATLADRTGARSFRFLKKAAGGWNQARSPPPALLLEARVPDDVWHSTYDAVLEHKANLTRRARERDAALLTAWAVGFGPLMVVVACVHDFVLGLILFALFLVVLGWCFPFLLKKIHMAFRNRAEADLTRWSNFVSGQNALYNTYGLQVEMLRIHSTTAAIIGVLLFKKNVASFGGGRDVDGDEPTREGKSTYGQENRNIDHPPSQGRSTGSNLIQDLKSLQDMHRSGVLTDEEYSNAKSTVLANQASTGLVHAQAEVVQEVVHVQAVAVESAFIQNSMLPPLS